MREVTQKFFFSTISIAILVVMVIFLAGCDQRASNGVSIEPSLSITEPSSAVVLAEETAVSPTVPVVETAVITPTVEIDHCLDCHINKDLLIETADPEEEVISENEGEG